jgi:hypothetical protein
LGEIAALGRVKWGTCFFVGGSCATIVGKASLNRGAIVDFVLTLDDNGDPGTADVYDMKSLCGGTGNLLKGNLDYRVRT